MRLEAIEYPSGLSPVDLMPLSARLKSLPFHKAKTFIGTTEQLSRALSQSQDTFIGTT